MKKIQWSTNQKRFFKKFRKNKLAMFGMAICVLVLFVTIAGPVISPYEASTTSVKERFSPPSAARMSWGATRFRASSQERASRSL